MKTLLARAHFVLTLNCEQSTRIVSDSLDRHLTFTERLAVRLHYIGCMSCRRFRKQIEFVRDSVQERETREIKTDGMSEDAKDRIRKAFREASE